MHQPATRLVETETASETDAQPAPSGPVRTALFGFSKRSVAIFFLQFAAILSILAMPWRGLDTAYSQVASAAAGSVLSWWAPAVTLEPVGRRGPEGTSGWHAMLVLPEQPSGQRPKAPFNLRYSYLPLAVFVSLAIAAPIRGWKRNLAVVGGGFAIMLVIALGLTVLPMFYWLARIGAIDLGGAMRRFVELNFDALVTPTMMYAIPFFVWWMLMVATRPFSSNLPNPRT